MWYYIPRKNLMAQHSPHLQVYTEEGDQPTQWEWPSEY